MKLAHPLRSLLPAASAFALAVLAALALPAHSPRAQTHRLAPLDASEPITYYVAEGDAASGYRPGDRELAEWALEAWRRSAEGALEFRPAPEAQALIRIYFVAASAGQYGEMQPFELDGRRGANVYVRPDTRALGAQIARAAEDDPLLRETIVYLTCLHELGHALGLEHTAEFEDVMYFFGYGGDVPRFFARYRDKLGSRADIPRVSGLSAGDLVQLGALY